MRTIDQTDDAQAKNGQHVETSPKRLDPFEILASIGEVVYDWDILSDRLSWGPNASKVLGVAESSIGFGRAYSQMIVAGSPSSRFEAIRAATECDPKIQGGGYHVRYGLCPDDNPRAQAVWVEDTGRWFAGADGRPARAHGLVRVITDSYKAERDLEFRSRFDPLTGCLNRPRLIEIVESLLTQDRPRSFCILLAGLDNLFALNRTYGYDVADEVIAALAARLQNNMRVNDHIARYAGNKFALVLTHCDAEQMAYAANRFLNVANSEPYQTSTGAIPAMLRIGGVCAPADGRKSNILFQNAEEAIDLARATANKRFVAFKASLLRKDSRLRAARVADDIVSALNDRRIEIALQPVIYAKTHNLAFAEALLRLRRPDGELVSPGSILPVAEQAGMVHLLDQRVLGLAVQALHDTPNLHLSVNVSGATIRDPEWPQGLNALLTGASSVAERLIVEITETCAIDNLEATRAAMAAIRELGVRVAMDDFGAGHTSFRNLRSLGFDIIKMDGAFVQNLSRSSDDRFFVRTLIDLAQELQTPLVAEWVETLEAAELLEEWGVDLLQGDYFGKAGPPIDVIANIQTTYDGLTEKTAALC